MQKGESPDVSCNTENARNTLTCLSTHLTPFHFPTLKSASISLLYRRCLKTRSLPRTSCPVENVGRHPFDCLLTSHSSSSPCAQSKLPLALFELRQQECFHGFLSCRMSPKAKAGVNGKSWGKAGGRSVSLDHHLALG